MNPISINALATAFACAGWTFGVPSIAVLLMYGVHLLRMRLAPAAPAPGYGDNADGLLAIFQLVSGALSFVGNLFSSLLDLLFHGLALVAAAALLLAIACWCTAHGLRIQALWGRAGAFVLLALLLVPLLLAGLSAGGVARVVFVFLSALCLVSLHTVFTAPRAVLA